MMHQVSELLLFPDPVPRRQAGVPGSVGYSMQTPELSPGIIDFCLFVPFRGADLSAEGIYVIGRYEVCLTGRQAICLLSTLVFQHASRFSHSLTLARFSLVP